MEDIIILIIMGLGGLWLIGLLLKFIALLFTRRGSNSEVLLSLHQRVAQGDTNAMLVLAQIYAEGKLVKEDTAMALKLVIEAAKLGNEEAKLKVAQFLVGVSLVINTQLGNDHEALFLLGGVYHLGLGVEKDYAKALEFYKKSAALGNSSAEFFLGEMYREGVGVTQDYAQAFQWYKKSAAHGDINAKFNLAGMSLEGHGVEQSYQQAFKYYKEIEAADPEYDAALLNLGLMYLSGSGVTEDYELAADYFKRAANLGNAKAQDKLEAMHALGLLS